MSRDIAVFVDGTTNDHTDPHPTNILKMHRLTDPCVTSLYLRGLGNEFDHEEGLSGLAGRLLGGAFGAGADRKTEEAYMALSMAWQPGDRVFLIGFSRGAAIVRDLAGKIHREGLNGHPAPIAFLGCFDTVASFGLPGNTINLFKDFHVAPNVEQARHAVALDETRDMFPVTLMNQGPHVKEVWFKGDHSDIGGGHEESGLSNRTLHWMLREAGDAGLSFVPYSLGADPTQEPHETSYKLTSRRVPGTLVDDEFHATDVVRYHLTG